jgi:predicted lysophospholipase L1 biosynthesis ABC-type transport system permease subunit
MTRRLWLWWSYPVRALSRGGLRAVLAIGCIAVGVLAVVALQSVGTALDAALIGSSVQDTGGDLAVDSTVTPLSQAQLTSFDQLQSQGQIARYTPFSVHSAQGRTTDGTSIPYLDVLVVDPSSFPLDGGVTFLSPQGGSVASLVHGTTVVVSDNLLSVPDVQVGTQITMTSDDGRVATVQVGGIFRDSPPIRYINNPPFLLLSAATYAALPSPTQSALTYTNVTIDVPNHDSATAASLEQQIQQQFPLSVVQTAQQAEAQFQSQADFLRHFLQAAALLALLISGVSISQTLLVLMDRRRNEIAVLKTLGYRQRHIYLLFGLEVGLLGLIGSLLGAAAGMGVSLYFQRLFEQVFQTTLAPSLDVAAIGVGLASGIGTTLVFGGLPLVRASQVRPAVVFRGLAEGSRAGWRQRGLFASALLAFFFALTASIVGNIGLALLLVGGGTGALLLLSLGFSGLVFGVSHFPLAVVWPGRWRVHLRMVLRNLGRQRGRSVIMASALFVSVFAIGLLLVLGLSLQTQLGSVLSQPAVYDAFVLVPGADRAGVDLQVSQLGVVQQESVASVAFVRPGQLNGVSTEALVEQAPPDQRHAVYYALAHLTRVQGYPLSQGQPADLSSLQMALGRTLGPSDADTTNALLPVEASGAPLNLKPGDQVILTNPRMHQAASLNVVGFYHHSLITNQEYASGAILTDSGVVEELSGNQPFYAYALRLDPPQVDAALQQIQRAVPSAQVVSLVDEVQSGTLLNRLAPPLLGVAGLALLAGVVSIANLVALALLERRRELGILKAIGYTNARVRSLVLGEQGVIGALGSSLAAVLVALVAGPLIHALYGAALPFTILAALPLLVVVLATVVLCLLVATLVAWGPTHVRPLAVLRNE